MKKIDEPTKKVNKKGCLILTLATFVSLFVMIYSVQDNSGKDQLSLKPSYCVHHEINQFLIHNPDSLTYHNVEIKLNGKYTTTLTGLLVQSTISIPLSDFANSDGERFNCLDEKVVDVSIYISGKYAQATESSL